MPDFELTDKATGRSYVITAPDAQTAYAAWQKASGMGQDRPVNDVQSGDEARARGAGDTRSKMRPQDIEFGYDTARARGDRGEQKAMARAMVERQRSDSPTTMAIGQGIQQLISGVPILGGLADEGLAGVAAATGGDYEKALDYNRALSEDFAARNPKTALGLQIGGGMAGGMALAGRAAPMMTSLSNLGGRAAGLAGGVAGGAAVGAADGFTRGEGVDDRIDQAKFGGVLGGAIGALAPVAGKSIQLGVNKAVDAYNYGKSLSGMGLSRPSANIINRAVEADAARVGAGAQAIRNAGPDAMLADAGPTLGGILDTTIQKGGPGARRAITAVEQRAGQAAQNLDSALDASLGPAQGVASTTEAIRQGSAGARSTAYNRAYNSPIDYAAPTGRLIESYLTRVPQSVIERANNLMRTEGVRSRQIMAQIAPDGTVTYQTMPDVRQLDYITRALNDVAKRGDGQGALGGNTAEGRAFGNLSRDIRRAMRRAVPEYGRALDTAADPIRAKEAMDLGAEIMGRGMARDAVELELRGMSRAEREMVRRGVRATIDETVANVKRTVMDPNVDARQAQEAIKGLSSEAARDKLRLVLGQQESDRLFAQIDQAATAFNLRAQTATNSRTFGRQAVAEGVKAEAGGGVMDAVRQGSPGGVLKRVWQNTLGENAAGTATREDRIYDEISRALTERRGADALRMLQELQAVAARTGAGQQMATPLAVLGAGALGGGAYPAIYQQYRPTGR